MSTILTAENISYFYNQQCVLDNISFTVDKGEFIIITGPNGGGKSTLARIISGELDLKQGNITINSKIGYAPQKLLPPINLPLRVKDFLNIDNNKNPFYPEIYNAFNIKEFEELQLNKLSGGQLQKVNLCMCIRKNYDIILLDEPDQNLDFESQKILYKLIPEIAKNHTFIVISHDVHSLYNVPQARVFCINKNIHCQGYADYVHAQHCILGH